jgi:hypothetical protein
VSIHDFYIVKAVLTEELNFLPVGVVSITMSFTCTWRLCLATRAVLLECNPLTGKGLYEHISKFKISNFARQRWKECYKTTLFVNVAWIWTYIFVCLVGEVRKCVPTTFVIKHEGINEITLMLLELHKNLSWWLLYLLPGLASRITRFCWHSVFLCCI